MERLRIETVVSQLPALAAATGCPVLAAGDELLVDDVAEAGAFGVVRRGRPASGPTADLVVKRFGLRPVDADRALRVVAELHRRLSERPVVEWRDAAWGLPYLAARVRTDAGAVMAATVGLNLCTRGFVSLETVLDQRLDDLLALPLVERLRLAADFATGQALWETVGLVHSDVNPPNLFVDLTARRAVVIDFDGGGLQGGPDEQPATRGKSDDFAAPEIGTGSPITPETERWSTGIAVSYLLLGTHPLFFLRAFSLQTLAAYRARWNWPDMDPAATLAADGVAGDYQGWREEIDQLSSECCGLFRALIDSADGNRPRPSPLDWLLGLQPSPPWFQDLQIPAVAVAGEVFTVSWWAPLAASVEVAGATGLAARGSCRLRLRSGGRIVLRAVNPAGTAIETRAILIVRRVNAPELTGVLIPRLATAPLADPVDHPTSPRLAPTAPPAAGGVGLADAQRHPAPKVPLAPSAPPSPPFPPRAPLGAPHGVANVRLPRWGRSMRT